jgi:misacylated tRNA(Ala) deacylase
MKGPRLQLHTPTYNRQLGLTKRLYWLDDHCLEATAIITGVRDDAIALDQSIFYPGGGGQSSDHGTITISGTAHEVLTVEPDADGAFWHECTEGVRSEWLGQPASLRVDPARRTALSRYHTVLHVLNTIAQRDCGAWITGAQIGVDYSRIDFKWDGFSPTVRGELEQKVNVELTADRRRLAYLLPEQEFANRPDLLRTLEVKPSVIDGNVRVVEIEGFDAQPCGGTHICGTGELGRFAITRIENKGRIDKRLYVSLAEQ